MTNLKPCPSCGGTGFLEKENGRSFYFVCCQNIGCLLAGPSRPTSDEALEAWDDLPRNGWLPIENAPRYTPVKVRLECGFECMAEFRSRGCSGMCAPRGKQIHTPHLHNEWVMVNAYGEEVHPISGFEAIDPVEYMSDD